MRVGFTPAAERVLAEAARWSTSARPNPVGLPELLMGLLAEAECRAANMLAERGVTLAAVTRRWPTLARIPGEPAERRWSGAVEASIRAARRHLADYPEPRLVATEHLLLGAVAGGDEAATWLRERGFEIAQLAAEIHRAHGLAAGPLSWEPLDWPDDERPSTIAPRAEVLPSTAAAPDRPSTWRAAAGELPAAAWRILDASANRAREGFRVVEDYVRFALDDRHLTEQWKQARHELTAILAELPVADRMASRETSADVGTSLVTPAEATRTDLEHVAAASCKRIAEALRSLEEYSKLAAPDIAARFEQLRYRVYTLERAVTITGLSLARLATTRLYVLIDARGSVEEFRGLAASLVATNVDVLQLRDKSLDDRRLLARARLLRELTRDTPTLFIMNDRPDLAALAHADGVHVGQEELSVKDARAIVGPRRLVGVSTHSLAQARQAVLDGADYIGVGPTFPSATKSFAEFPGLDLLRQVAAEIRLPAFAIGGVTLENLPSVLATGVSRVAVSGAIVNAMDPASVCRTFHERLRSVGGAARP